MKTDRRDFMRYGTAALVSASPLSALLSGAVRAQGQDTLTIAYNVGIPSWDPTTGLSSVNPTLQSVWKAVFDQYIDQNPDLSLKPGILTKWGWNADKTKVEMEVRQGVFWQDGKPLTADDVV